MFPVSLAVWALPLSWVVHDIEEVVMRNHLDDKYTILTIDQTRQVLSTLIYAWFPEGERPSPTVTGACDSIKLLGAVSDSGDTFFLPCAENFNSGTTIRLLDALQTEFGEKICVVLDNASHFTANVVQEFVEDTTIELCYLPRGSAPASRSTIRVSFNTT